MLEVCFVAADVDLGVLGVRHDLQQVLRQDVERVDVVQREYEDGRLGELEVAGGDGGDPLEAARVPQLELGGTGRQNFSTDISTHLWPV